MKVYSSKLLVRDLHAATQGYVCLHIEANLPAPRLRIRGWKVKLVRHGSRRFTNTGTRGAGERGAASYDDYGAWIAEVYSRDREAIVGPYRGFADFHTKTAGKYLLPAEAESLVAAFGG